MTGPHAGLTVDQLQARYTALHDEIEARIEEQHQICEELMTRLDAIKQPPESVATSPRPIAFDRPPTAAEIEAAKTPAGGWTRAQLAAWGVSWPPRKGWKARLIAQSKIG